MSGFGQTHEISLAPRVRAAAVVFGILLSLLIVRLWYLQALQGDHFRVLSENNRRKTVFIPPPRGIIYDRSQRPLVRNRPAFNIEFDPTLSPDPNLTMRELAAVIGVSEAEVAQRVVQNRTRRRYEPKVIVRGASRELVDKVAARTYRLPGVVINTYPARDYLYGDFAAHVIGYIREITKNQLDSPEFYDRGYRQGDVIGQYGIEKEWELELQGSRGRKDVIVNARGLRAGDLASVPAQPGRGLTLTIDFDTQQAADLAMADKAGAVVAIDPKNGEIIAMTSSPRFDPNIFSGEISAEVWADLVHGPGKKLSNRSVQGAYPPGSVFKAIMGTAGLAEGVITSKDRVSCAGGYHFGSRTYHCHKRSGHGSVNLYDALVQSCDVYFYMLGQRLGVDGIHEYASRFGLGRRTGLELVYENPGLMPSTAWKAKAFQGTEQARWWPGETLSVAIGQGATLATPLQMANAITALVNGGKVYKPHLVRQVLSPKGVVLHDQFPPEVISELKVDDLALAEVRKGLFGVVNDARGTGRRSQLPPEWGIDVAGKTGTSQVVSLNNKSAEKHLEHHAWFVGYAPADKPEIVVVALVEHGGGGGAVAAPVVGAVMKAFFQPRFPVPTTNIPEEKKKNAA